MNFTSINKRKCGFSSSLCLVGEERFCYTRLISSKQRGFMKAKSIFLGLMAGLISVAGLGVPVSALGETTGERDVVSTEANRVMEKLFLIRSLSPAGNMIEYDFNNDMVPNMGIWELYLATYDYENVPMAVADAGLGELGVVEKPDWAKAVFYDSAYNKGGNRTVSAPLSYTPGMDIGYGPGILYYALKVYDGTKGEDNAEFYWARGKISYRECAYNSKYGEPYMRMTCTGKIRGSQYSYDRWRETGDVYKTWGDDWGETLAQDLKDVRGKIGAWTGDEEELSDINTELDRIEAVAEDATEKIETRATVTELRGLLKTQEEAVAKKKAEEEEKRRLEEEERLKKEEEEKKRLEEEEKKRQEEEKRRQEEEEKRLEEERKKAEANRRPSLIISDEAEKVETELDNLEDRKVENAEVKTAIMTSKTSKPGNLEGQTEEKEGQDEKIQKNEAKGDVAEVPNLRVEQSEIKVKKSFLGRFWWVILVIVGGLMGAGWWIKRRNQRKI